MIFQSTHPSGVRPQRLWERALIAYFNPRTPVGCDVVGCHLAVVHGDISIHAPQWGATQHHHHLGAGDQISIHAPQWGATNLWSIRLQRCMNFNPRTPVGCDQEVRAQTLKLLQFQSTHPSGVRPALCFHPSGAMDFNPRTPVGCDPTGLKISHRDTDFNPRTPVGCDGAWDFTIPVGVLFQSTHPSGVRHDPAWRCRDCWRISIHAPQWGATQRPDRHQRRFPISIHAPQWGATIGLLAGGFLVEISIHAPQWGATIGLLAGGFLVEISIHAPQWGATRAILSFLVVQEISIHAPQWGATLPLRPRAGQTSNFNPRTPVGCDVYVVHLSYQLSQFQSTHPSGVRRCRSIGMVRW